MTGVQTCALPIYSTEREGYDGLIKSDADDIATALTEFTWKKTSPTDDQTIKMYGNVNGDKKISAGDYMMIVDIFMGETEEDPTIKDLLTADVSNDSKISASDYMAIVEKIMDDAYVFPVLEDE